MRIGRRTRDSAAVTGAGSLRTMSRTVGSSSGIRPPAKFDTTTKIADLFGFKELFQYSDVGRLEVTACYSSLGGG